MSVSIWPASAIRARLPVSRLQIISATKYAEVRTNTTLSDDTVLGD
ncbi:MAG: hypothetical protein KGI33_10790 [Thaumarchaeota archaeon]|nr:hypothetical protein [Nitrososphaerota archaeon]